MKARLKASKTKQVSVSTTLNPIVAMQLNLPLFATAGSVLPSKKTTSQDKSNLCEKSTRKQRLSKTLGVVSTLSEKVCKPYWSDLCAAISSRLLLPVETDSADSDLNYSSSWQDKTVDQSWFSQILFTAQSPNSQPIFLPSFTSSRAECTDSEVTARKSRKIRIFLSPEQKALLKQWFGVSRYVYNATIKYLQEPGTKAQWMAVAPIIMGALPDWAKSVPYQIKKIAVKDACLAVKAAKKKYKQTGSINKCQFRTRRDRRQTVFIPKSAIKTTGIYHTILGIKCLENPLKYGSAPTATVTTSRSTAPHPLGMPNGYAGPIDRPLMVNPVVDILRRPIGWCR